MENWRGALMVKLAKEEYAKKQCSLRLPPSPPKTKTDHASSVSSFTPSEARLVFGTPRAKKSPVSLGTPISSVAKTKAWLRSNRWSSPTNKLIATRVLSFAERSNTREGSKSQGYAAQNLLFAEQSVKQCTNKENISPFPKRVTKNVPLKSKLIKPTFSSSDEEPLSILRQDTNNVSKIKSGVTEKKLKDNYHVSSDNSSDDECLAVMKENLLLKVQNNKTPVQVLPISKESTSASRVNSAETIPKVKNKKLNNTQAPAKIQIKESVQIFKDIKETGVVPKMTNTAVIPKVQKPKAVQIIKNVKKSMPLKLSNTSWSVGAGTTKKAQEKIARGEEKNTAVIPKVQIPKPVQTLKNLKIPNVVPKLTKTGPIPNKSMPLKLSNTSWSVGAGTTKKPQERFAGGEEFQFALPSSTPKRKLKIPEKQINQENVIDLSSSTGKGESICDISDLSDISPLNLSRTNMSHAHVVNNSTLNSSTCSNISTRRSLRSKKVSQRAYLCTSDDEEEETENSESEVEWNVDDPGIKKNCNDKEESINTSCDSSEDDQVKVTLPKKALGTRRSKKLAPKSKNDLDPFTDERNEWVCEDIVRPVQQPVTNIPPDAELREPHAYFQYFFDDSLLKEIVQHTNSYITWKGDNVKNKHLTVPELKQFLGVWMYMGVNTLPGLRDYWSADTLVNQVAKVMSFNRFQKIRSSLHFFDKTEESFLPAGDRFAKVSLILDHMKEKCNNLQQESYYSIDETMVPYKGRFAGSLRQFIRNKPHRFGIKIFNLAGASGIVYDFLPYAGSETFRGIEFTPEEEAMGLGAKVVISLARTIKNPEQKSVFFDNYFASVKLVRYLKEYMQLLSTGTVRNNRIDHCPLTSDKELKAHGRGAYDFKSSDGVQVTKWMDNKIVHLVSTLSGVQPEGIANRYDKASKSRIGVPIPQVIQLYNSKMGGVDLSDMLVEMHRSPTRARRWYITVFGYMMDLAVTNSWLVYKRHASILGKQIGYKKLKTFKLALSHHLRYSSSLLYDSGPNVSKTIKLPRLPRPSDDLRYDRVDHWPSYNLPQGRCKYCKTGKTTVICGKCNLHLCFVPTRQCFLKYHLPDMQ